MAKKPTIRDISEKLKVDPSTVSRALNGNDRISKKTRDKVLKVASELGYSRNVIASNLRTGRGNTIGVVVPKIQRSFFAGVINGIESVLNKEGYNLLICQSNEKLESEINNISVLLDNRVAGIIISVSSETNKYSHLQRVIDAGIPLVQFDRVASEINSDCVENDNRQCAYEAVCHLAEQGYKHIVHLSGPIIIRAFNDRVKGYREALQDCKLNFNNKLLTEANSEEAAYNAVEKLLSSDVKFDAIFTSSDYSALGALKCLRNHNLNVPKDIGIIGFGNETFTEVISPSFTTLHQFKVEMGIEAANLVLAQLDNDFGNNTIPKRISFKPKLIIRESSQKLLLKFPSLH